MLSLGLRVPLVPLAPGQSSAGNTQISTFTLTSVEFLHLPDARSERQRVTFTTSTPRNPLRRRHAVEQLANRVARQAIAQQAVFAQQRGHDTVAAECKCGDEFISIPPTLCPRHLHSNSLSIQFGSNE